MARTRVLIGAVTLAGTAKIAGGAAFPLGGDAQFIGLEFDYQRGGLSTTGQLQAIVATSGDDVATAPGSVGHLAVLTAFDPSSFSGGAVNCDPLAVTFGLPLGGTYPWTYPWPNAIDVRGRNWLVVEVLDTDSTHPGTVSVYVVLGL